MIIQEAAAENMNGCRPGSEYVNINETTATEFSAQKTDLQRL